MIIVKFGSGSGGVGYHHQSGMPQGLHLNVPLTRLLCIKIKLLRD